MCDIHNNVESCNYDGGDCCGPNVTCMICNNIICVIDNSDAGCTCHE